MVMMSAALPRNLLEQQHAPTQLILTCYRLCPAQAFMRSVRLPMAVLARVVLLPLLPPPQQLRKAAGLLPQHVRC